MRIEVVAIGDEVIGGWTVNSNAATISRALFQAGFQVAGHRAIPDEPERVQEVLGLLTRECDLVICSGGLGPTLDDRTRNAVADLVGCDFRYDEEVAADLRRRYGDRLVSQQDQATIPAAAKPFLNDVGTAPGLLFEFNGCLLILLPGVPMEMESILTKQVLPYLKGRFHASSLHREGIHLLLVRESEVDPIVRELQQDYPAVAFGIYPGHGVVSVQMTANEEARGLLKLARERLEREFGERIIEAPSGHVEEAVHRYCIKNNLTFAAAESCTGGVIASRVTAQAGASGYFMGSAVVYSNESKQRLLDVSESALIEHGAVSEQVVREMVLGALRLFSVDYAVAVSGVAGPSGGTAEKPVGTVWIAVGSSSGLISAELHHFSGPRAAVIQRSANHAFAALLQLMHKEKL
jgi:competence/damage-inducible protein CinA-like protein